MPQAHSKNFCQDCGQTNAYHYSTWLEEMSRTLLPSFKLPKKIETLFDVLLEKVFISIGLAKFRADFTDSDIQMRSACFVKEMRKRGGAFRVLQSVFGFTNHFKIKIGGKTFRFEALPTADFASKYTLNLVDDKEAAKIHCKKGRFPVAEGRAFWFWQNKKALAFGQELEFPLVVKPRGGSVSRHVTTDIQDQKQLKEAICHSISYSPAFIVEKFIANAYVYRATVIDFDFVACVKQIPANVVGDGASTIRELIEKKNSDPSRGEPGQKQFTLYKITEDQTTRILLAKKGYSNQTIPSKGETVYLQKDPFLKLGGDLVEVTPDIHQDNLKLFRDLARFFDIRLTGIDFLAKDISASWKNQSCAILELNSVPCIELHHFPSSGTPTNPAKALADMFFKYYL